MIKQYITYHILSEMAAVLLIIGMSALVSLIGILSGISRWWERRQQRYIDKYFENETDELETI